MKPSLYFSEIVLTFALISILSSLVLIAKFNSFRSQGGEVQSTQIIDVTIVGCVAKPGTYPVEVGTPLNEVLSLSSPKKEAKLDVFDQDARVTGAAVYVVDTLTELTLWVEGACVAQELNVPLGTRICDLKELLTLNSEADMTFFKKKRKVGNKEKIKIPLKK